LHRTRYLLSTLATLLLAMTTSGTVQAQAAALPPPFKATYAVSYRGLQGGKLTMQWSRDSAPNRYVFETRVDPTMLASLFVSDNAFERSVVEATGNGVRPLLWETDDGKSGQKGDGKLTFDWASRKVTGTYKGKPVELPLAPGVEDRLSIQISVMAALLQGREPGNIRFVNGDDIREYTYTRGKTETMQSKLGPVETIVYESTRPGSNRLSRFWHAPSLDYVPVRLEQVRKGKVETVMELIELERDQAGTQ
jgi:hypothetical protein